MPVWGTMIRIPSRKGRLLKKHRDAIAERGRRASERVERIIGWFRAEVPSWPTSPQALLRRQRLLDRLRTKAKPKKQDFKNFFDALIFDRDGYTCRYCGRDAFAFFKEMDEARTLWLVVDHLDAAGKLPDVYHMSNSVTACWTCNTIKGPLPEPVFLQELDSLIASRRQMTTARLTEPAARAPRTRTSSTRASVRAAKRHR